MAAAAKKSSAEDKAENELYGAFLSLQNRREVKDFLADLATPAEIRAFVERWRITRLLDEGKLSYREIADEVGASTTTVTRCARFLRDMPFKGYRKVLDRMGRR